MNQFFEQLKADIVATHAAALQAATQEYETKMEALRILAGEPEAVPVPEAKKEPKPRLDVESLVNSYLEKIDLDFNFSVDVIVDSYRDVGVSKGSVSKALQRLCAAGLILVVVAGKGRKATIYRKIEPVLVDASLTERSTAYSRESHE